MVCTATTQPEVQSFGGVSDVGFSLHTAPTFYSVSKYFMLESRSAELEFWSPEIQKLNVAEIYMNRKHMEVGSERNKRWDLTINGNRVGD